MLVRDLISFDEAPSEDIHSSVYDPYSIVFSSTFSHTIQVPDASLKYIQLTCELIGDGVANISIYDGDTIIAHAPKLDQENGIRKICGFFAGNSLTISSSTQGAASKLIIRDAVLLQPPKWVESCIINTARLYNENQCTYSKPCIVLGFDANFALMASQALGSLYVNGNVADFPLCIVNLDGSEEVSLVAKRYGAHQLRASVITKQTLAFKQIIYSVPHFINAPAYLFLDGDMIVLQNIRELLTSFHALGEDCLRICVEQNPKGETFYESLAEGKLPYLSTIESCDFIKANIDIIKHTPMVNIGTIAVNRRTILGMDNLLRNLPTEALRWEREVPEIVWRDQALFNIALGKYGCMHELHPTFNVQMALQDVKWDRIGPRSIVSTYRGHNVRILHFSGGDAKTQFPDAGNDYNNVSMPIFGATSSTGDIDKTLAFIFANNYFVNPCKHLDHDGAFWQMRNMLSHIRQMITKPNTLILDVDTFGGLGACIAQFIVPNSNVVTYRKQALSNKPDGISELSGDVLASLMQAQGAGVKYDFIILDNTRSTNELKGLLLASRQLLKTLGKIVIIDHDNPACLVSNVLQGLRLTMECNSVDNHQYWVGA